MTIKNSKVSVCVVTYNQEKYIRRCLQSLVDQDCDFDLEVIVGDDCSTDGTHAILREFSTRYPNIVRSIRHEKNIGPYRNYLSVHKLATGNYIAHIDGDDCALANKLKKQATYLNSNPDCIAVVHKLALIDHCGETLKQSWPEKFHFQKFSLINIVETHPAFGHSSLMYRNGALKSLLENAPLEFIDFYVYIHLASQGKIGAIEENLGAYTYGVGISASKNLYMLAVQALEYARRFDLPEDTFAPIFGKTIFSFCKKGIRSKR